ncbi:PepSY-associated TM helix domain-containing protein [Methylomonas sp. LL1]|uniref:PepSY-associated TM helix domain-containing protein n=1 Tax=Methylomonas sp. LL1 TaxID=2785785 RepID=UPI001E64D173|nr:PepSY-associated TM helix domain-containing protein [Methylomonas sp. LL1]
MSSMPRQRSSAGKAAIRRFWLAMHLYLGLTLGAIIAVTGLSGSLLVFYNELDTWLNPALSVDRTTSHRLDYEAVFQALRRAEPNRPHGWRLEIPDAPNQAITARYYRPAETAARGFAPLLVSVDPYSGDIVANRFWGEFAMTWLYDLHYSLLLGKSGKIAMAVVGGLLLISLASGVYLWWPPRHKLINALTLKAHGSPARLNYDLHKLAGIYGLIVLLVLTLTGIALEIPDYVNPLINTLSPPRAAPNPYSDTTRRASGRISLDQALAVAGQRYPDARPCWIETPRDADGSYRINFRQPWEPSRRFPKTNVWIDQYSGAILAIDDPSTFAAGDTLLTWLHPLHSGEALGLSGRLLVLISGLACPLLFVTGMLHWQRKRRVQAINRSAKTAKPFPR